MNGQVRTLLAGYLRRCALQEWLLLSEEDKQSATTALRGKLEIRGKVLVAQDFRQKERESVADRLYLLYGKRVSYCLQECHDTREKFLYGQLATRWITS